MSELVLRAEAVAKQAYAPYSNYLVGAVVRMNDGTELDIGLGDIARIEPGHDAWVVGDEPCVAIDFGPSAAYAKPQ